MNRLFGLHCRVRYSDCVAFNSWQIQTKQFPKVYFLVRKDSFESVEAVIREREREYVWYAYNVNFKWWILSHLKLTQWMCTLSLILIWKMIGSFEFIYAFIAVTQLSFLNSSYSLLSCSSMHLFSLSLSLFLSLSFSFFFFKKKCLSVVDVVEHLKRLIHLLLIHLHASPFIIVVCLIHYKAPLPNCVVQPKKYRQLSMIHVI